MATVSVIANPSYEVPNMAFNNGQVTNGMAVLDSSLPNIPGPESDWKLIEWSQVDYLDPTDMITNDKDLWDPNYGNPLYTWQAAGGLTSVSVYSENGGTIGGAPYVYALQESNESTTSEGSDLFLSASLTTSTLLTFNHPVTYSLDAKMTAATATGGALAQAFSGFIVTFNASGNPNYIPDLPTINAFMQVAISNSSGDQARYLSQTGDLITYTYTLPEDQLLAYTTTTGHPTALSYSLNQYLDDLIANDAHLPSQATNLSLWNLDSMYIGEETNDRTANDENAGQVNVGLQISNINLATDYSLTASYENPSTFETNASTSSASSAPAPAPPILFTMTDTTQSNTTIPITADSYNGPLSFLSHSSAFSYNGSDNVQVTAVNAINPLIATGSGVDLLTGSSTGTSVLDAGTNANIETDGGNGDTTFIQNGYVAGTTWDFIQNFHGADEDIIFGYIPGLSKIAVQAVGGLGSDMGATVTIHPGNGNIEEATFVGIGLSALHGTSAMIDGVPSWVLWT